MLCQSKSQSGWIAQFDIPLHVISFGIDGILFVAKPRFPLDTVKSAPTVITAVVKKP
jgi:hypothetical protein